MKHIILTLVFLSTIHFFSLVPALAQRAFNHPGSILTKVDLERIKQHVNQKVDYELEDITIILLRQLHANGKPLHRNRWQ